MLNWFNMKKKSLPQQVLENTKDIEKLYDQELSDITQLNYKQDAEDSLTYADGKATFKGKMSIIRNENTQNLVVDSEIEVNISSGDDDIIIDAGEDNVSLKIRLDNETRNKINRALLTPVNAPTERSFVMIGTNNAETIVDESEILNNYKNYNYVFQKFLDSDLNVAGGNEGASELISENILNIEEDGKYLVILYGYCHSDSYTCAIEFRVDDELIVDAGTNSRVQTFVFANTNKTLSKGNHNFKLSVGGRGNMVVPAYHRIGYTLIKLGGI